MKYQKAFLEHFQKREFFTLRDAKIFLSNLKISQAYLKVLIHNLLKKRDIKKIGKGKYTFQDDASFAGFAFEPFYYGLQHALTLHRLWNQATNLVIITPRKVRTGTREIMGQRVIIRRINPKLFFGYETIPYYGKWLPVSTIEKTLIDFVYYKQKILPETLNEIKKRLNQKKLQKYLKKCPKWVKKRVEKILKN